MRKVPGEDYNYSDHEGVAAVYSIKRNITGQTAFLSYIYVYGRLVTASSVNADLIFNLLILKHPIKKQRMVSLG